MAEGVTLRRHNHPGGRRRKGRPYTKGRQLIATAVEEQTATTAALGHSVEEAARGSSEIAQNIMGVADVAKGTSDTANDLQSVSHRLSEMSTRLQGTVRQFRF